MFKTHITLLILIIFISQGAIAQNWNNRSKKDNNRLFEIGISIGGASFVSTYNPNPEPPETFINYWNNDINPGIGVSIANNISPVFGIEIGYLHTSLTGTWNDKWPPYPVGAGYDTPLTYDNSINQYELLFAFNISKLISPRTATGKWNVYVRTGPGITNIIDHKEFYNDQYNHNYNRFSWTLDPGVSYQINDRFKLKAGSSWKIVTTDNVDGIHIYFDKPGWNYNNNITEFYQYTYVSVHYCLGRYFDAKGKTKSGRNSGIWKCR